MTFRSISKPFAWLVLIGGILGLAASAALTIEKMMLLQNPNYKLSCSFNEIFACGSIVTTEQASVFGFANSIIGIIAFPVLITVGLLGLFGTGFPKFVLPGMAIATALAHIFVLWLVYQSLYVIGALCPWCMVVWAVTIPINFFSISELQGSSLARNLAGIATVGWFAIVAALIAVRFYI
jgi:uncharacterized membrane protein